MPSVFPYWPLRSCVLFINQKLTYPSYPIKLSPRPSYLIHQNQLLKVWLWKHSTPPSNQNWVFLGWHDWLYDKKCVEGQLETLIMYYYPKLTEKWNDFISTLLGVFNIVQYVPWTYPSSTFPSGYNIWTINECFRRLRWDIFKEKTINQA